MLKVSKVHGAWCMVHETLQGCIKYIRFKIVISHVKGVKRNKDMHNGLDPTHLLVMSKVLKVLYIHNQYTSIE